MFMGIFMAGMGQSFFKSLPKHTVTVSKAMRAPSQYDSIIVAPTVKAMDVFRPVLNLASYSYPSKTLLTGMGVAREHLLWNAAKDKWDNQWSVGAYVWYNAVLANSTEPIDGKSPVAVGIAFTFFNGLIVAGCNTTFKQVNANLGFGINLN